MPAQIAREQSVWWDNIETKDVVETKQEIILRSYKNSIAFLKKQLGDDVNKWNWSRVEVFNLEPLHFSEILIIK